MYVLGLNIGHNSTACLLKDGKIIGCVSEERFSRIKNHCGIPFRSIDYLLKQENLEIEKIDYVVLDNHYPIKNNPDFGKQFLEAYTKPGFSKRFFSSLSYSYPNLFNKYYGMRKNKSDEFNLKEKIAKILKTSPNKVLVIDHHLAHSLSTGFNIDGKTLVFTLDGEGSGVCATAGVYDNGKLEIIARTKKTASLGYLYAISTIFLGMKPLEHEFKVMGLAPYAKKNKVDEVYKKLNNLIWVQGLEFKSKFSMPFADNYFRREMKFYRFDNIAGGVQKLTEELTSQWIKNAIEKTGIHNIAVAGGVFMNVKASQKISEMPEVEKMFVMPSCGDESNAIGCCMYGYRKFCETNKIEFKPVPIEHLYLGPEYDNSYIEKLIKEKELDKKYKIKKIKDINNEAAKLLAKGFIVARCSGKSEWGARALGNRSIMANALHPDTIRILNETIKDRDFWMPFTPSIIDKYESRYVVNPKKIKASYMVITFNSTEEARKKIPAAMHPYDQTLRPQIVTKEYNKDYYEIIEKFSKLTGSGGILNTSFNLHGEPNVLTPEDALHTVENSSLKFLVMGNYLFEKKRFCE